MFVQVIKGRTSDAQRLRSQGQRWSDELRPGATGFLGGTGGLADDGTFILFARFADEAAARANSSRPEQTKWWDDTVSCFDGEPSFRESSDVSLLFDGGSDDARFVQIMEGTVVDRQKADAFMNDEMMQQLREARPDLLGGLTVYFDDGSFAEIAYFTSETDARAGESSTDFSAQQQEFMDLFRDVTFTDIREPMLTPAA